MNVNMKILASTFGRTLWSGGGLNLGSERH